MTDRSTGQEKVIDTTTVVCPMIETRGALLVELNKSEEREQVQNDLWFFGLVGTQYEVNASCTCVNAGKRER